MKNIHIKPNRGLHFCISRCNLLCNLILSLYIRGFVPKVTRLHWLHLFYTKNIFFYFLSYISNRNRQQQYLLLFYLRLFIILFMSSMLPPSIILPPETAPDEPIGSQTPTVDPNTGLNPYFDQFNQMQQGFQNTMQQIQNDPFPLIEQFLGQRAMSQVDQATEPMKQEAIQKVSGVMSGIRSLVNEAFPNMGGGGMSTTGQLGQGGGIASLGGTAIPAAPFTKPAEIPSTPMQPPMMGDPSPISTTNYVPKVGLGGDPDAPKTNLPPAQMLSLFNQQMGGPPIPDQMMTAIAEQTGPQPMGEPAGPPPGLPPMVGGSGMGNPMALIEPPMIPKIADVGGPVSIDTFDPLDHPAMEYNPVFPMPIQKQVEDPLINLAYNFNMENSPF